MKFLHFNIEESVKNMPFKSRKRYQSKTVAAIPLSTDILRSLSFHYLNNTVEDLLVPLQVGVTYLSLKDRYVRAEGRKNAIEKMKVETLKVIGMHISNTHIFIHLDTFHGINLSLRLNKKTGFSTVVGEMIG